MFLLCSTLLQPSRAIHCSMRTSLPGAPQHGARLLNGVSPANGSPACKMSHACLSCCAGKRQGSESGKQQVDRHQIKIEQEMLGEEDRDRQVRTGTRVPGSLPSLLLFATDRGEQKLGALTARPTATLPPHLLPSENRLLHGVHGPYKGLPGSHLPGEVIADGIHPHSQHYSKFAWPRPDHPKAREISPSQMHN